MSRRSTIWAMSLTTVFLVAGCPAPPDTGPTTPPSPSLHGAAAASSQTGPVPGASSRLPAGPAQRTDAERKAGCGKMAAASCPRMEKSWPKSVFSYSYGSIASCREIETAECMEHRVPSGARISVASMNACAKAMALAHIDAKLPECELAGWRADGETCSVRGQCNSRACYDVGADGCGRCGPLRTWSVGTACKHYCGSDLGCVSNKCVKKVALGGACLDDECAASHVCLRGRCTKRSKLGQACDLMSETAADCEEGLLCPFHISEMGEPLPSMCVKAKYATAGAACSAVDTLCARSDCHEDVCKVGLEAGASCDAADYKRRKCHASLACVQHKCVRRSSLTCGSSSPD